MWGTFMLVHAGLQSQGEAGAASRSREQEVAARDIWRNIWRGGLLQTSPAAGSPPSAHFSSMSVCDGLMWKVGGRREGRHFWCFKSRFPSFTRPPFERFHVGRRWNVFWATFEVTKLSFYWLKLQDLCNNVTTSDSHFKKGSFHNSKTRSF